MMRPTKLTPLPPPDVVFFDLGNVLCGFDWRESLTRLGDRIEDLDTDAFTDWLLGPGPHEAFCRGQIDQAELLRQLHQRLAPHSVPDEWLRHLWNDMFEPWPDSMALVHELRGRVTLGLISDTNPLHFEHLDRRLKLRKSFDVLALSYEVGVLKPDPRIFEAALQGAGANPEHAFFTDDIAGHVESARRLGMRGEVFTTADELRSTLAGWSLIDPI